MSDPVHYARHSQHKGERASCLICNAAPRAEKPVYELLQEVFNEAVAIARDRNQARGYGNSWRSGRTGIRGLVAMCDHKTTRLTNQLFNTPEEEWPLEEALDSALDAVNYSAFIAILLKEKIAERQARRTVLLLGSDE